MKVIVVLDDNSGMMFNHRRQSRDKILINDVVDTIGDNKLFIDRYSEPLFANSSCNRIICSQPLSDAGPFDYCFIENKHLSEHIDSINTLIIYRWNRNYPHDFDFDINLQEQNFILNETKEFQGSSHEKITKEVYTK